LRGGSARNGLEDLDGWERGERINKSRGRMIGGRIGFGRIQFEAVAKSKENGYKEVLCDFDGKNLNVWELGKGFIPSSSRCNGKEMAGMGRVRMRGRGGNGRVKRGGSGANAACRVFCCIVASPER
jgi:hypothetical protein